MRCPPGVICLENKAIFFGILTVLLLLFLSKHMLTINNNTTIEQPNPSYIEMPQTSIFNQPPVINQPTLINIPTNIGYTNGSYQQLGLLTATNTKGSVMALMGRQLFTNRNKWQYYTLSDQQNSLRLPISKNGKSCTNEYGCDELYNGDTVYVEGLNDVFTVTKYETNSIPYVI